VAVQRIAEESRTMPQSRIRRYLRHGTLPQLSVFEAIARHGSFTRAAEELFLAQPTVSIQLKKLTETIGLPLVEQVGRKIHLTDAGRELQAACRDVFGRLGELEERYAAMRDIEHGRLRVAVSSTGKYFVPRLLGHFLEKHPNIEVAMDIANRDALLARLAGNVDDVYFFVTPPVDSDVVCTPILPNPIAVFARADHPLAGHKRIPVARLAEEVFLLREPGSGTRMIAQRLFEEHSIQPKIRMELGSNEAIKQAIIGGLGISILSQYTMGLDLRHPDLVILDIVGFPLTRQWYLVHAAGKQLSKAAEAFCKYVRTSGRKEIESHLIT
jgi:DNA-binding transcriptional LysR family regulator